MANTKINPNPYGDAGDNGIIIEDADLTAVKKILEDNDIKPALFLDSEMMRQKDATYRIDKEGRHIISYSNNGFTTLMNTLKKKQYLSTPFSTKSENGESLRLIISTEHLILTIQKGTDTRRVYCDYDKTTEVVISYE